MQFPLNIFCIFLYTYLRYPRDAENKPGAAHNDCYIINRMVLVTHNWASFILMRSFQHINFMEEVVKKRVDGFDRKRRCFG